MNHTSAAEAATPVSKTASDATGFALGSRLPIGKGDRPNQACRAQQS